MRRPFGVLMTLVICFATQAGAQSLDPIGDHLEKSTFYLDFASYRNGPVEDWLLGEGFTLEQAADDPGKIHLGISDGALVVEARERAFGLIVNQAVEVETFSKVRIEWGVSHFPEDASYENQIKNEAIMVYFAFGEETYDSGSFFVPDSPYFIGVFLCTGDDRVRHAYVGRYHKENGRYVCLDQPAPGESVISEFDLMGAFRSYFGTDRVPAISSIGVSVDTTDSHGGGASSAFIRAIEFVN